MKSAIDIQDDVYAYLKETALITSISGVMRSGRPIPPNSKKEDVWIKCLATECGEIEEAIVIVNVYIPDVYNDTEEQYELDKPRARTLAALCNTLFEYKSINGYHIGLQTQSIDPVEGDGINKHFISNRLLYRHNTNT